MAEAEDTAAPEHAEDAQTASYCCVRRYAKHIQPDKAAKVSHPDLNLLHTLDVLLDEGSVTAAARRLQLSPSAMSRSLARLRSVTGDELLVRAGRGLVPTPRAEEMRERVRHLVEDAEALLRPEGKLDLLSLDRVFTLRTSDGIAETFGPALIRAIRHEAPGVTVRFVRKLDKDSHGLRDGSIDLETGVVDETIGPEVRAQALFEDRYIAAVAKDHPLARKAVTSADYASWPHVVTWRQGMQLGGVEKYLADQGLQRRVVASVDGFSAALSLARGSDLIATVPEHHTSELRSGMHSFALPLPLPSFKISVLWHPRMETDPAHAWLRQLMRNVCVGSGQ